MSELTAEELADALEEPCPSCQEAMECDGTSEACDCDLRVQAAQMLRAMKQEIERQYSIRLKLAAENERLEQALEKAEQPFDGSETGEVLGDE